MRSRNDGDGARMRQAWLLVGCKRIGEAPRERHGNRLQNGGVSIGKRNEIGVGEFEHDRVAERRDGRRSFPVGEEGDLANGCADTHLGNATAVDLDSEAARSDAHS